MKKTSVKRTRKGGLRPSTREPCNVNNVEERLMAVNDILTRSEEYTTREEQQNAVNEIVDLIAPNEFGRGLVLMNADALVTNNEAFRNLLVDTYAIENPNRNITQGGDPLLRPIDRKNPLFRHMYIANPDAVINRGVLRGKAHPFTYIDMKKLKSKRKRTHKKKHRKSRKSKRKN